jgi:hypothetical protein
MMALSPRNAEKWRAVSPLLLAVVTSAPLSGEAVHGAEGPRERGEVRGAGRHHERGRLMGELDTRRFGAPGWGAPTAGLTLAPLANVRSLGQTRKKI